MKSTGSQLNDLNEPTATTSEKKKTAPDYLEEFCLEEADEFVARLTLNLEEDEKEVHMSVGRGRGPHQKRN